ncbi:MAG: hypothetical protein AAB538_04885 [Patescibacteria group bacterium]
MLRITPVQRRRFARMVWMMIRIVSPIVATKIVMCTQEFWGAGVGGRMTIAAVTILTTMVTLRSIVPTQIVRGWFPVLLLPPHFSRVIRTAPTMGTIIMGTIGVGVLNTVQMGSTTTATARSIVLIRSA